MINSEIYLEMQKRKGRRGEYSILLNLRSLRLRVSAGNLPGIIS